MAEFSKIEWTDHTFNPWIGCQHVSPGCDHCYAEQMMDKRYHRVEWGPHGKRIRTSDGYWKRPGRWNRDAQAQGRRFKVFCASLADWLDNKAERAWREDLADLINETPNLDWLLLTKRIENYAKLAPWQLSNIPKNVWLGVTCENQKYYNRRWPILREIDARVRFVSYEPALGRLEIGKDSDDFPDWIICGGESGSDTRFMKPKWARRLRDECAELGVAFFMKQMTEKKDIPDDLLVREVPSAD